MAKISRAAQTVKLQPNLSTYDSEVGIFIQAKYKQLQPCYYYYKLTVKLLLLFPDGYLGILISGT